MKQLESTSNALKHEINAYQFASYNTMKRRKIFGVHSIQDKITLTDTSIKDRNTWRFVELRSAVVPTCWAKRKQWTKVFEWTATLYVRHIHIVFLREC